MARAVAKPSSAAPAAATSRTATMEAINAGMLAWEVSGVEVTSAALPGARVPTRGPKIASTVRPPMVALTGTPPAGRTATAQGLALPGGTGSDVATAWPSTTMVTSTPVTLWRLWAKLLSR